jgi:hypothetical protein
MNANNNLQQLTSLKQQYKELKFFRSVNNHKRELLEFFGYQSVKKFQEDYDYRTSEEAYLDMLRMYNQQIDETRLTLENEIDRLKRRQRDIEKNDRRIARQLERDQTTYAEEILDEVNLYDNLEDTVERRIYVDLRRLGSITRILADLLNKNRKILISCGDSLFAITIEAINRLMLVINGDTTVENPDSSVEIIKVLKEQLELELVMIPESTGLLLQTGAFFPFTHLLDSVDLSRYAIYKPSDMFGENYAGTCCLLYALDRAGVDIEPLKTFVKSSYIPQRVLPTIANSIKRYIVIHSDTAARHLRKYGNPKDPQIDIALVKNHYFLMETTKYTSHSIENYFSLNKEDPKWNSIVSYNTRDKRPNYDSKRFINSYDLVRLLVKLKDTHLKSLSGVEIYKMTNYKNLETEIFPSLEFNDGICHKKWNKELKMYEMINPDGDLKYNEPKKPRKNNIVCTSYFDFETVTARNDKTSIDHTPYVACCADVHEFQGTFEGDNCGKDLLTYYCEKYGAIVKAPKKKTKKRKFESVEEEMNDLIDMINEEDEAEEVLDSTPEVKMIAHSLSYDIRFLIKHLYRVNTIEKGSSLMSARGFFYHKDKVVQFSFIDSLQMISMKLEKFQGSFNLDINKAVMPSFDLYTQENVEQRIHHIDYVLSFVEDVVEKKKKTDSDVDKKEITNKETFLQNAREWDCIVDDVYVDIVKYSNRYCMLDCLVLKAGYEKFTSLVKDALDVNVPDYISMASMAHDYLIRQGCYEGVLQMSGIVRAFIQRCVIGGKCMTNSNLMWHIQNDPLADSDFNSLYPSAMVRMEGFLLGKPKIIVNFEPHLYDGYFICIRVTHVGKYLEFPLQNIMIDGVKQFSNELVGHVIYVDKTMLEDLIVFQQITFEFLNGYYYDEGFNVTINKVMDDLYKNRTEYKRVENPIELVFKLCMNSSYGMSILKPIDTNNVYIEYAKFPKFVKRHYNSIQEIVDLGNETYRVVVSKPINRHFNNAPVGVSVLSTSKRILNEVLCTAQDMNMKIWYVDTDSTHIADRHVIPLGEEFKKRYGKELYGDQLGQMSTDFKLKGAVNAAGKKNKVTAIESFFLGKKSYIDHLRSTDKKGDYIYGHHIRMKGITEGGLNEMKNTKFNGDPMLMYKEMYDNKKLAFNLLAEKPKFEMCTNMTVKSKKVFIRNVQFKLPKGKQE